MGAFLPGSTAVFAATVALCAAILQPLPEYTAPPALATASAKPNPITDHAELARRSAIVGYQHPHRACHEDDCF